jgi:hypothetical protein
MSKKPTTKKTSKSVETVKPKPIGYIFGRPTDYEPRFCEMLIKHMAEGYSFESFAAEVMSTKKTLYSWAERHPDFLNSKEIGTDLSRKYWEKLGKNHILNVTMGGDEKVKSKSLNSSVWIFNMKNRFPQEWRDKKELEHSGKEDKPVVLSIETKEQRIARLKLESEEMLYIVESESDEQQED